LYISKFCCTFAENFDIMEKKFKISDEKIKELYLSGLTIKEVAVFA